MGTNFYLYSNDRNFVKKHFAEYSISDDPDLHYEIHLCKRSGGWRPLFQKHRCFQNFTELEKFIIQHPDLPIYDEYGTEYTFEEFKQAMIDHSNIEPEPMKWVYDFNPWFKDKMKSLFTKKCKPEEAELWTPFSHREYAATEAKACQKFNCPNLWGSSIIYTEDPDYKFDWTEGDFS